MTIDKENITLTAFEKECGIEFTGKVREKSLHVCPALRL